MKIVFLGTNGWYDTDTGNTLSILIETKKEYIVLDAGNGIHKLDRYVKKNKPIHLFLSHYHIDHISGLHTLLKFRFRQGMRIFGPPGLHRFFRTVINSPYTAPLRRLHMKTSLTQLGKGTALPVRAEYRKLLHSSRCYGYRFALEGRIVTFCTDTGMCHNLKRLAKGADLFIAECSFKRGQVNRRWQHLNPETAAKTARDAGAKRLALVHFDASRYTRIADRNASEKYAKRFFSRTVAARDGMTLYL